MDEDRREALAFLLDRVDYERVTSVPYGNRTYKLERMRRLLSHLGDPHLRMPVVHIAGSKGKGSTAAMIAAVMSAAGYRTGLYSSPHLERLEERMAVDGRQCTAAEFVDLVASLRAAVERMRRDEPAHREPTYFELTTAMACSHFANRGVDVAVLEVGMGGRLDSTNVCSPAVSVITSISLDHTKQLGNTLAAIAGEKAGIVKPGVPVVSGVTQAEPRQTIEAVSRQRGSRLIQAGVDFDFHYRPPEKTLTSTMADPRQLDRGRVDITGQVTGAWGEPLDGMQLGLLGRHQAANAAVAVAAIGELTRQGWQVDASALRAGLADVQWPVRVELVRCRPAVVLDAAHNVASLAATIQALDEHFLSTRRWLVFATTQDKDVRGMLELAVPQFDRIILTRYQNNPRGVPVEQLDALAAGAGATHRVVCPDPSSAWRTVLAQAAADELVCVTGSFFLATEIRAQIRSATAADAVGIAGA